MTLKLYAATLPVIIGTKVPIRTRRASSRGQDGPKVHGDLGAVRGEQQALEE